MFLARPVAEGAPRAGPRHLSRPWAARLLSAARFQSPPVLQWALLQKRLRRLVALLQDCGALDSGRRAVAEDESAVLEEDGIGAFVQQIMSVPDQVRRSFVCASFAFAPHNRHLALYDGQPAGPR